MDFKSGGFLYLTKANPRQHVSYTSALLQEGAVDWWVALLKDKKGRRPDDFPEMVILLEKWFGGSN